MKSFVALSAAALLASSVAAHGPTGQRQSLHRRGVERLHRRAKPAVETRSTESSDATETTAIWWAEDGWVGACGSTIDNNKPQVGLPLSLYANADAKSSLCGTKAYATNPATGASVTVTVVDGSDRTAFTTFSKSAYLALGGDADVGMLPIQLTLSKEANAGVVAAAGVVANNDSSSSSSKASSAKEASSSAKDVEVPAATTAAPAKTTAAPAASTTPAPTTSYDSESAAAASKAAASAAAADASASSKAAAKAYESEQANIIAASQASAAQASQAAAAAASSKAAADAAASQEAAAAAASSKAAQDAAAAAAASSSKAAAAASASAAAAAADNNDNSSSGGSSGGHVYSGGYATYYLQNSIAGNCGAVNPDSAYIVALPTATYAGGSHCGQKVRLTRVETGKTITATVADSCPTCVNNSCLDLSVAAFTAIATEEEGMVSITWEFI
ncbi:hypothetical protein JCM9279_005399 [Rhodotorula babjevae]